jgi:hypothetical protein
VYQSADLYVRHLAALLTAEHPHPLKACLLVIVMKAETTCVTRVWERNGGEEVSVPPAGCRISTSCFQVLHGADLEAQNCG